MPIPTLPKWTNTLCGLRAPRDRIDNKNPTCPDCLASMKNKDKLPEQLSKLLNEPKR